MRSFFVSLTLASTFVVAAACSKADSVESDDGRPASREGGTAPTDEGGITVTTPPNPPKADGSTTPGPDAGNPSFDITKVATITGTFVTDQTANDQVPTTSTVTWSFTISGIGDPTQPTTTATWNAHPTNVTGGGTTSDFPPDTNIALSLQQMSGSADPRAGAWEFYGNELSPYVYILVKYSAGQIVDFHYYRRILDDTETNPVDKPRNLTFTTTNK